MNLNIGENIKRLRREKKVTQEQIADYLSISVASVSKWERNETYPDITNLIPLAHYFNVTLDELLGYDEERTKMEIKDVLDNFHFHWNKDYQKAVTIITEAYKKYPNNYDIMHWYMWTIAGGSADNDKDILLANKELFTNICDILLEGSKNESYRMEAYNMKAKIMHAEGNTNQALELLDDIFLNWYQTSNQKKEQLYSKDSNDFLEQLTLNIIELSGLVIDKKMKEIWYNNNYETNTKIEKSYELLDYIKLSKDEYNIFLQYSLIIRLTGYLKRNNVSINQLDKAFELRKYISKSCNHLTKNNTLYYQYVKKVYNTDQLI